jgi:hypothetical protein
VILYGKHNGIGVEKHFDGDFDNKFKLLFPHTNKSDDWIIFVEVFFINEYI